MENYKKKTKYEKILEAISIVALFCSSYPLLFYSKLESSVLIPVHYDIYGVVDRWGPRHSLWILQLIPLILYFGLSILQQYPKIYNYPCKVTEQNANYLYRMGVQLIRHVKVFVILSFAYISNVTYAIAIGKATNLNMLVLILFFTGMFLSLIIYPIKMIRYKPKS